MPLYPVFVPKGAALLCLEAVVPLWHISRKIIRWQWKVCKTVRFFQSVGKRPNELAALMTKQCCCDSGSPS